MVSLVNDAEMELLKFLCTYPTTKFSISEISRKTGLSKPWVAEKVQRFKNEGIATVTKTGNMKQVGFNQDSQEAVRLKRVINLETLYNSDVLDEIIDEFSYPQAIILFGSFAQGEDVEKSDVDIAVITTEEGKIDGEVLSREIALTTFKPGGIPATMLETLANGIVLYGYLDV